MGIWKREENADMAFMGIIFASVVLVVIAIGLGMLFIGIILDIRWWIKKRKQEKVSRILKGFAVVFTVWGIIQGIGPMAFFGIMNLSQKIRYRAEISNLPKEAIVHLDDDGGMDNGIDFKGVHYVTDYDLHPQESHDNIKTIKAGAIVYNGDQHYIIKKIVNDLDTDIFVTNTIYDPLVPETELSTINDYYHNKAPLYCEVIKDIGSSDKKTIKEIDGIRIRAIRDDIIESGANSTTDLYEDGKNCYLFFYSFDDIYCVDFNCLETDKGILVQYLSNEKIITGENADYLKSLIK